MLNFLTGLSLRHKLHLAFAAVLVLLLAVSVIGLRGAAVSEVRVHRALETIQPAMLAAMELQNQVNRAGASMGFYLKSGEAGHRQAYEADLALVQTRHAALAAALRAVQTPEFDALFDELQGAITQFAGYAKRITELVTDPSANTPALRLANQTINPANQVFLQAIGEMLSSEGDAQNELINDIRTYRPEIRMGDDGGIIADTAGSPIGAAPARLALFSALQDVRYTWSRVVNGVRGFLATREASFRENTESYLAQNEAALQQVLAAEDVLTFEQADALARLREARATYLKGVVEIFKVHGSEQAYQDVLLVRSEIGPLMQRLGQGLDGLVSDLRAQTSAENLALAEQVQSTRSLLWGLLVGGLVLGFGIAWSISRSLSTRLNRAVAAMREIAEGEADLTRELDLAGRDELAQLAQAFNRFLARIRDTMREVAQTVDAVVAASQQMAGVCREADSGTCLQKQQASNSAASTTELLASAQDVAQMANSGADAARVAQEAAQRGQVVLDTTQAAINRLASEVERAAGVIAELGQDSDRIGGVLDVIRGVAEQTNLLALNAAIEAARAGDQGRGFAVVADEVRTLASRTQSSTAEIQGMIARLQAAARQAASVMEDGRGQARDTVQHAEQTRVVLAEILASVDTISGSTHQIAQAAGQQSGAIDEINRNIVSILDVADRTGEGTANMESLSRHLAGVAERLTALVRSFRIA